MADILNFKVKAKHLEHTLLTTLRSVRFSLKESQYYFLRHLGYDIVVENNIHIVMRRKLIINVDLSLDTICSN